MKSFCIMTTLYVLSIAFLFHELRSVTPEARYELQAVSLMLLATLLYFIAIWKNLSQMILLGGG